MDLRFSGCMEVYYGESVTYFEHIAVYFVFWDALECILPLATVF